MNDKDTKLLEEAYNQLNERIDTEDPNVKMDVLIDLWEDTLAEVDIYLNKQYAGNVPKLVEAMRKAIEIHNKIEELKTQG